MPSTGACRYREMLGNCQAWKNLAFLGNVAQSCACAIMHLKFGYALAVEENIAGDASRATNDQLEERALANAIAANDRHALAAADRKRKVLDDGGLRPAAREPAQFKC
jgi:hypothetical protein